VARSYRRNRTSGAATMDAEQQKMYQSERIEYPVANAGDAFDAAGAGGGGGGGGGGVVEAVVVGGASNALPANAPVYYAGRTSALEMRRREHQHLGGLGVLVIHVGALKLEGSFVVPRKLTLVVMLHGAKIDMRRAQFLHPQTTIRVVGVLGGVKVWLPPNTHVEVHGAGIMGAFKREDSSQFAPSIDAPTIRVIGIAIMGGCKVMIDGKATPLTVVQ